MGFELKTLHFTHISPSLTIKSTVAQWLEHPARFRGLWVKIPSGTQTFSEFSVDNISVIQIIFLTLLTLDNNPILVRCYSNTHVTSLDPRESFNYNMSETITEKLH